MSIIRPKKNICVFQVSRPYLGFWPDPKHFIVLKKKYIYIYINMQKIALWSQNMRLDFGLAGPFLFRYIMWR